MRRVMTIVMTLGVVVACLAPASAADEDEAPLVSKVYAVDVVPSQTVAFEQALHEHVTRHAAAPDPWPWHTWQVVNGRDHGQYLIRSPGHRWRDFDERAELDRMDRADFSASVAPHIRSITSWLERLEPGLSAWSQGSSRPALVEVTTYELAPDGYRDFYRALEQVHLAVAAQSSDMAYAWSVVFNGGEGPTMILAVPHASWAELASTSSPWEAVSRQYGQQEADLLRARFEHAIRSRRSAILAPRDDLSYEPEASKPQ